MSNTSNEEILEELRRITKLLTLSITKNQTQKEQIQTLSAIGFQPKEIAEFIGTTANTVRVTLTSIRKESKRPRGKTKKTSD
jgi:DNA-binding CsgD family transcriptional regulator